ncbi:MAG: PrgI family protein [Oscillospiraceae bacterium]|jgi:hypothetical protein|nr:PrgI family protein [Oscillospiraceae bacterium]
MAFVNVPKDLSKVKTKVALNLTKRQLLCFGAAAVTGIPAYIFSRGAIGNSAGALLMIAIMLPLFFLGIYEKDGMPAEEILRNFLRVRFIWPGKRPYVTENLYTILEKEGIHFASQNQTAAKAAVRKRPAGKGKQQRRAKDRPKRK